MSVGDPRDVVALKRDGKAVPEVELRAFVLAYGRGEVGDDLAAAFLMAAYIRGLSAGETLALTRAMVDSGGTMTLEGIFRPTVDKHSTGGVADGVTLVFAPVAAQSPDLVPADGALYALRDATATVASIPLIAASVMSKKLCVGTDLILLDVKAGSGAFMKTPRDAGELARACTDLAAGWGRRARVAVTDMSQPLGEAVGNALDVAEAVEVLTGGGQGRLLELTLQFAQQAGEALLGLDPGVARSSAEDAISSGRGLESFARMIEAQGGDPRVTEDPWAVLPRAGVVVPLVSDRAGAVAAIEAEEIGRASVDLGAGRKRKGDSIDPSTGIVFRARIGDRLEFGDEVGEIHARDEDAARAAARRVLDAITVGQDSVEPPPLVFGWTDSGVPEGVS